MYSPFKTTHIVKRTSGEYDFKQWSQTKGGIDVTVAEKWEGDLRTGGSLGGSNPPIWKLPGLPTHGDQP